MKKALGFIVLLASALAAQTLTLSGPATIRPGQAATVNLSIAGSGTTSVAALQWDLTLPAGFTAAAVAGAASTAAAKTLACNPEATRCITYGINTNTYAAGVVAVYTITAPAGQAPGAASISLSNLIAARLDGQAQPISAGAAYAPMVLANTDLNGDGKTDVLDLQILIPIILGPAAQACPVPQRSGAGATCNVLDLQIVARAAAGA